jgi:glycosyltransferase involved in cell wall biosynthesis
MGSLESAFSPAVMAVSPVQCVDSCFKVERAIIPTLGRVSLATFDILLPVRNGVPFLHEAIESVRNQTVSDWRLLILDHGSQDGSLELSQRCAEKDARIEVFTFPAADSLADLLNKGLEKCDCKYIVRQDSDDVSLANRMAITDDLFCAHPDYVAIGGDVLLTDEMGRQTGYLPLPIGPLAVTAASFFYNPMHHPSIAANLMALRRYDVTYGVDFLRAISANESAAVNRFAEDYFLFGQLAMLGTCANAGLPLIKYRRHGGTVGRRNSSLQIESGLQISRFLAKSYSIMRGVSEFDPTPFCNHLEHVFDFQVNDYTDQFEQMAAALREGLGESVELERELTFRRILATRDSSLMAARYLQFRYKYRATSSEWHTVRNWLLRNLRKGKYVYRVNGSDSGQSDNAFSG